MIPPALRETFLHECLHRKTTPRDALVTAVADWCGVVMGEDGDIRPENSDDVTAGDLREGERTKSGGRHLSNELVAAICTYPATKTQLAARCGVFVSELSQWSRGVGVPRTSRVDTAISTLCDIVRVRFERAFAADNAAHELLRNS